MRTNSPQEERCESMSRLQRWFDFSGCTPDDRNRGLQACANFQHTGFLLPGLASVPLHGHHPFRHCLPRLRAIWAREGNPLAHCYLFMPRAAFCQHLMAHFL